MITTIIIWIFVKISLNINGRISAALLLEEFKLVFVLIIALGKGQSDIDIIEADTVFNLPCDDHISLPANVGILRRD